MLYLPKKTKVLFIIAASTFILGALGFEFIEGWRSHVVGGDDFIGDIFTQIEETLEILGIIIFNFALLDFLRNNFKKITIVLE